MSERKVLSKYYPPNFDPAALTRKRGKKADKDAIKTQVVRVALPFTLRCTSCGEFMYRGRKFNARKEIDPTERYLDIQMVRITLKCTRCSSAVTYRTDPKNGDYTLLQGAIRNMEPWRDRLLEDETDEQRLDRLEREEAEAADEEADVRAADTMEDLEARHSDARREMEAADALDAIRHRNARLAVAERDGFDAAAGLRSAEEEAAAKKLRDEEEELDREARERFQMLREKLLGEKAEEPAVAEPKPVGEEQRIQALQRRKREKKRMPGVIFKRKAEEMVEEPAKKDIGTEKKKIKLIEYDSDDED
jgi:ribosomal protein L33